MKNKDLIAIIGSREPTQHQVDEVTRIIKTLNKETQRIVSGCAFGIDAWALKEGQRLGFETVGILPWPTYNLAVQAYCSKVICIADFDRNDVEKAYNSVYDHHPAPGRLSQGAMKLQARNWGIIFYAKKVIACPGSKPGGGGTGQGIRLVKVLNIPITII